ncbi:MAG: proton-conducting transporter membrane subunit [Thermoplasmatota archaeon]
MSVLYSPEVFLLIPLVGALVALLLYKIRTAAAIASLVASGLLGVLILAVGLTENVPTDTITMSAIDDIQLSLSINWLSYLFVAAIGLIAPLILLYSLEPMRERAKDRPFYALFMLSLAGGIGVAMARDLLTLFFMWELMTWSSLLLIGDSRKLSGRAFRIYLAFGMLSALSILMLAALSWNRTGTVGFDNFARAVAAGGRPFQVLVLVLGLVGFGTKAAMFPFHVWAPGAYAHTPDPFTAFFSGGLSKAGIYGVIITVDVFVGIGVLTAFGAWNGLTGLGLLIAILGALTALVGGVMAMFQDDAKKLLAYSSVSQLGYIFVGIGIGSSLGIAGALYHVLNHTVFKALLFMGIGAVIYRTGESRLSRLGGMIHVMPATFFMFLVGIFAAAAIPITSGLASKWLIYESALDKGIGVLVPILFIASVAAFLYSFRILQGGFMGQLRDEFRDIREAPVTMLIPMGILTAILIMIGFAPGLPMILIEKAMEDIGMSAPSYSAIELGSGVGTYSGLVVMLSVGVGFLVAAILFFSRPLGRKINLRDTFTSGEEPIPKMDRKFHYAYKFYYPYERVLKPYFNNWTGKFYHRLFRTASQIARLHRSVFNGDITAYIWLIFGALILIGILLWQYGGWF